MVNPAAPTSTAEIYLVRHGQTVWNACGRLQGALDSPLTEKGRSQAMIVGECLAGLLGPQIEASLVASPMGRAQETAALIAAARNYTSVVVERRIAEVSFGAWDGLTREEIQTRWPDALHGATALDWHSRAPDSEPYEAAFARAEDWLREAKGTIVAVSHGVIGRIIRSAYLGQPIDEMVRMDASPERIWHLSGGNAASIEARKAHGEKFPTLEPNRRNSS